VHIKVEPISYGYIPVKTAAPEEEQASEEPSKQATAENIKKKLEQLRKLEEALAPFLSH
jgi:hypothetical protein